MFKKIKEFFKFILGLFGLSFEPEIPPEPIKFDPEREAKVILTKSKKEIVVPKWSSLKDALPYEMFGCKQGYCGTCTVQILEGEENLTERKKSEPTSGTTRRACQAVIKQGIAKIKA